MKEKKIEERIGQIEGPELIKVRYTWGLKVQAIDGAGAKTQTKHQIRAYLN